MSHPFDSSSIHWLNADRKLGVVKRKLWFVLNHLNNFWFPNFKVTNLQLRQFSPEISESDWSGISLKSSPSRALSDLFWRKFNWSLALESLSAIHVFDTGCGKGTYSQKLMDFSSHQITSYLGIDSFEYPEWHEIVSEDESISFIKLESDRILGTIPRETNFFISQSALEHFERDLVFFDALNEHFALTKKPGIQIHLFPSAPCIDLYPLHGVRQYIPRTVSKIVNRFEPSFSEGILFSLGGMKCNDLHNEFITRPLSERKIDLRDEAPENYNKLLRRAIESDSALPLDTTPSFYALVLFHYFKNDIIEMFFPLKK